MFQCYEKLRYSGVNHEHGFSTNVKRKTSFQNLQKMLILSFIFVNLFCSCLIRALHFPPPPAELLITGIRLKMFWFFFCFFPFRLLRSPPVTEDTHLIK